MLSTTVGTCSLPHPIIVPGSSCVSSMVHVAIMLENADCRALVSGWEGGAYKTAGTQRGLSGIVAGTGWALDPRPSSIRELCVFLARNKSLCEVPTGQWVPISMPAGSSVWENGHVLAITG